MTSPEVKSISELTSTITAPEQEGWAAALAVVSSMSRDYHDNRSHPSMSLEDHIIDCRLTDSQASFVRERLREMGMTGREMAEAGLPQWLLRQLGAINHLCVFNPEHREWSMAEIRLHGRRVICFIPLLLFIDVKKPGQVYQG